MKKFFNDFYNVYLTILGVLTTLPVLAPILLKIGLNAPAKVIYFIYSFFCHQFASRSIDIFDFQYAWCARDTAIWFGIFSTAVLVKYNKLPKMRWYFVIPFIIPIALDGGLQTIFTFLNINPVGDITGMPLYVSNNFSRFMTGAIFGIGVGWWISQQLKAANEDSHLVEKTKTKFDIKPYLKSLGFLIFGFAFFYFGLVTIWGATSTVNRPLDALDTAVKTPATNFFARRGDAICSTTGVDNLLDFECFFGTQK